MNCDLPGYVKWLTKYPYTSLALSQHYTVLTPFFIISRGNSLYNQLVQFLAYRPACGRGTLWRPVLLYLFHVTYYFYYTYNSFTLPFQGRTLNTHAAEANLHRFPLPQAPGWGAIQFLTTISKCKVARNFRLGIFTVRRINTAHASDRDRNRFCRMRSARATITPRCQSNSCNFK